MAPLKWPFLWNHDPPNWRINQPFKSKYGQSFWTMFFSIFTIYLFCPYNVSFHFLTPFPCCTFFLYFIFSLYLTSSLYFLFPLSRSTWSSHFSCYSHSLLFHSTIATFSLYFLFGFLNPVSLFIPATFSVYFLSPLSHSSYLCTLSLPSLKLYFFNSILIHVESSEIIDCSKHSFPWAFVAKQWYGIAVHLHS